MLVVFSVPAFVAATMWLASCWLVPSLSGVLEFVFLITSKHTHYHNNQCARQHSRTVRDKVNHQEQNGIRKTEWKVIIIKACVLKEAVSDQFWQPLFVSGSQAVSPHWLGVAHHPFGNAMNRQRHCNLHRCTETVKLIKYLRHRAVPPLETAAELG